MTLGAVSHLAFGVRDMDRSLAFYRDLLGMTVLSDRTEPTRGGAMYADPERATSRRVANLRWEDGGGGAFLVLSTFPATTGEAIRLDQVGIHHVALWATGVAELAERLRAAGVAFVAAPMQVDARGYGGQKGQKVLTCLFCDPDGIILQLDEKVGW